jgi:acyl-CoA thioester hydrolase
MTFTHSVEVRYLEVDQQGVVFNMWYLAYLDDAMTAYLLAGGLPYTEMIEAGYDVQLVHTELARVAQRDAAAADALHRLLDP